MKAFFVLTGSPFRNKAIISLLSAFADIETVGPGRNVSEAVATIRRWYPAARILDSSMMDKGLLILAKAVADGASPLLLMTTAGPACQCTYMGVDFSAIPPNALLWFISLFFETLRSHTIENVA